MRVLLIAAAIPFGAGLALAVACSSGGSGSEGANGRNDSGVVTAEGAAGDVSNTSDGPGNTMNDSATGSTDGPIAMMDSPTGPGPYPPGPYGNNAGDVLANLSWDGYVNKTGTVVSTTLPYGPTTLQDLRGDGKGFALIHLSDFY